MEDKSVFYTFQDYLEYRTSIPKENLSYYLYWINKFFHFPHSSLDISEQIDNFISSIARKHPFWQIEQARDSILHYQAFIENQVKAINLDNTLLTKQNQVESTTNIDSALTKCKNRTIFPLRMDKGWNHIFSQYQKELRLQNKAYRTEKSYLYWIRCFSQYTNCKNPVDIDQEDAKSFLTYIVMKKNVSISTQKQAFIALLFLFRFIFHKEINNLESVTRSRIQPRIPVILSQEEVIKIFNKMDGVCSLMARLIYGGGLRLTECLELRIKDIDIENHIITVRSGKGDKDRRTLLSNNVIPDLRNQILSSKAVYESDRAENREGVSLPRALERKYPLAGKEWSWFWVFPSEKYQSILAMVLLDDTTSFQARFRKLSTQL
jgi:integrase